MHVVSVVLLCRPSPRSALSHMSNVLKPADFQSLSAPLILNVRIGEAETPVELAVTSVRLHPTHRFREQPFSLSLSGPRQPALPQGIYPLRHPQLGRVDLFLVPSGQDAQSTQYEVTFN